MNSLVLGLTDFLVLPSTQMTTQLTMQRRSTTDSTTTDSAWLSTDAGKQELQRGLQFLSFSPKLWEKTVRNTPSQLSDL